MPSQLHLCPCCDGLKTEIISGLLSRCETCEGRGIVDSATCIDVWNLRHSRSSEVEIVALIREMDNAALSDDQLAIVLSAINGTCSYCWNAPKTCKCWMDDVKEED